MPKLVLVAVATLFLLFLTAAGAQELRPYSGCGVLLVRPLDAERPADRAAITLYQAPDVGRIGDFPADRIPSLSSVLLWPAGDCALAVMGKKGNWLRLAYDAAGREGWVRMERFWEYTTWDQLLKGRTVRVISGLKKGCALRAEPQESAKELCTLSERESFRVVEVREEWALVEGDGGLSGWIPWRDGDGRLQISVGAQTGIQKH